MRKLEFKSPWTTIRSLQEAFPSIVIANLGRIYEGSLMVLLKSNKFCVTHTSWRVPKTFQVIDDEILIEAPSSMFLWFALLPYTFILIYKVVEEGRQHSFNLLQSKEITWLPRGGSMEIGEMNTCVEESNVTRRTWVVEFHSV